MTLLETHQKFDKPGDFDKSESHDDSLLKLPYL